MGLLDIATLGVDIGDITGSNDAADALTAANTASTDAFTDAFNTSVELQQPFLDLGLRNLETLEGEVAGFTPQSRLEEIRNAFTTSPGFQNSLTLGRDQIEAGAAGQGSLFSGNTLKGLERFRTNLANEEFGNFSNQFNNLASDRLNRLQGLGNIGVGAATNLTNLTTNQGENLSQSALNQGNIGASQALAPFNSLLQVGNVAGSFF